MAKKVSKQQSKAHITVYSFQFVSYVTYGNGMSLCESVAFNAQN